MLKQPLYYNIHMWIIIIKEDLKCEALVGNYGTLGSFLLVSSMRWNKIMYVPSPTSLNIINLYPSLNAFWKHPKMKGVHESIRMLGINLTICEYVFYQRANLIIYKWGWSIFNKYYYSRPWRGIPLPVYFKQILWCSWSGNHP